MKFTALVVAVCLFAAQTRAEGLPDLGDVSQTVLSPAAERKLGEEIMRELRADPSYLDDPEINDYLNSLGNRLAMATDETKRTFEFFAIQDNSVNAFALPGGFIGVHTGTIITAQSESELASVLAHEIGHVTQNHIARMLANQQTTQMASLAALALGILAARSNSQLSQALITGSQAASIQTQLNFTRDNEREADRVGVQTLDKAGFDVRAMPVFFERMQRATRTVEAGAPAYLRTHPLTYERIADIENRTQMMAYRQVKDSTDFQMLRAMLRANVGTPRQAVAFFEDAVTERKFASEAAAHYGLVAALLRTKDYARARRELDALRKLVPASPIVDTIAAYLLRESGETAAALEYYQAALVRNPGYRALIYDYCDALLAAGKPDQALKVIAEQQVLYPRDAHLFRLQARGYTAQGKQLLAHRAQAEAFAQQGNIGAAIEQLQIALRAGDGDFYQLSGAEARLRQLRNLDRENQKQDQRKP